MTHCADVPLIRVAAGVLRRPGGEVLIAQRPPGAHAAGFWEFPGGKIRAEESPLEGLSRELAEEIGIRLDAAEPLLVYRHAYPDRAIELNVFLVTGYRGEPAGLEGQQLQWLEPERLMAAGLLPADQPIVTALLALACGASEIGAQAAR